MDQETRALIHEVAEETAKCAVKDVLTKLGIDHSNPFQIQKDMAALRELRDLLEDPEIQKDLMHLRKWRVNMETIQSRGIMKALGLATLGALAGLAYGAKVYFFGG
jgi:hypothetical protein